MICLLETYRLQFSPLVLFFKRRSLEYKFLLTEWTIQLCPFAMRRASPVQMLNKLGKIHNFTWWTWVFCANYPGSMCYSNDVATLSTGVKAVEIAPLQWPYPWCRCMTQPNDHGLTTIGLCRLSERERFTGILTSNLHLKYALILPYWPDEYPQCRLTRPELFP